MMTSRYIWMNGELVESERASVPFLNAGLHYGVSVFEGIRAYATDRGTAVFRLREHVDRLLGSAKVLGFRVPYDGPALAAAVRDLVRANRFEACYIRPVIYLAEGGWDHTVDSGRPHVGIAAWAWSPGPDAEALERGIRAHVSSFTRHHPNAAMTKAKIGGQYVNAVLARTEARRLGFDEAIVLDPQGYVAEGSGANLFVVRGRSLMTPPAGAILEGITRDTVITLARDAGLEVSEETLSRDRLYLADEVFLTGTAAEVVALREIDFRTIGAGRTGPVTRTLQRAFQNVTRGWHVRSAAWLDYLEAARPAAPAPAAEEHPQESHTGYGHGV